MWPGQDQIHSDDPEERLGSLFLVLSRAAHGLASRGVGELDMTPAQARALAVLGHCELPPTMTEMAKRLHVVPRAMTPVVDALEEAGHVRREVDPSNRRSTFLVLTEQGQDYAERMRRQRIRAAGELFAPLDGEERARMLDLLEKVFAAQPEWISARGSARKPSPRS